MEVRGKACSDIFIAYSTIFKDFYIRFGFLFFLTALPSFSCLSNSFLSPSEFLSSQNSVGKGLHRQARYCVKN